MNDQKITNQPIDKGGFEKDDAISPNEARMSKVFYEHLLENIDEGILVMDENDKIFFVNESMAKIAGIPKERILGLVVLRNFSEGTLKDFRPFYLKAKESLTTISFDSITVVTPAGRTTYQSGTLVPLLKDNHFNGMICTIHDVTGRKKAEMAFTESEERLRAIINNSPIGAHTYELEDDGRLTLIEANPAGDRILNMDHSKLSGMKIEEAFPMMPEESLDRIRHVASTGQYWIGDFIKNENKKISRAFSLFAFKSGPKQVTVFFYDITERKRVEESLSRSEKRFSLIFHLNPDPIAISDMDTGNIIDANEAFTKWTGYSRKEVIGASTTDLHLWADPEERRRMIDELTATGEVNHMELRMRQKNGHVGDVLISARFIEIDQKSYLVTLAHDMTERKQSEEALRKSEERYRHSEQFLRLITDNVQDAIRVLDLKTIRYTYANAYCQKLFGIAAQNYIDSELGFNLDAEGQNSVLQDFLEELEHDQERDPNRFKLFELRERNLLKNETIWTENKASFIRDAEGRPTALLSITRDITDRKKMEEERQRLQERLSRSEKMEAIGTLAGGVAHDLNNVLGVLVGYSELMLEKVPEGSPLRKYVNNILQSGQRGAAIVQDLLTLARRGLAIAEVVNLNQSITNYLMTPEFENVKAYHPHITFKTDLTKDLLNIKGSPIHLGKTIMNLISNAAEAISDEGEVAIHTENLYLDKPIRGFDDMLEGDYAVLSVSDTGHGISSQDISKIFEPFYTKKAMGRSGTGLGLAVVWGTMKDHNGYIDVQSEEGKGTTFTLYFPVTREEPEKIVKTISPDSYMSKGESILVVDDMKGQRELAMSMLERLGYQVDAVTSGEEAIEFIKKKKTDLIVLDMIMEPGIDGAETYRRILEINPGQKAVIVSGFSETDRVKKVQEMGAGTFVRKPYLMEKIGFAIRKELDRK